MSERVIKFRSTGRAIEQHHTTLEVRTIDRYELIRGGGIVRLPDGAECLANPDSWETIRVADAALMLGYDGMIPGGEDRHEYIATVNIRDPFDPDTWNWRDITRLAPVAECRSLTK